MKLHHFALTLALLATSPWAAAQINPGGGGDQGGGGGGTGTDTLLFTTTGLGYENTVSGAGALLSHISRRDVGVITPAPGASAETFLDEANFNVMHGDKDCDGVWFDPLLGDAIDAITVCGDKTLAKFPRFMNVFISVKANVGVPGLTAVMTPGDVASPRLGGAYAYLITEQQIRTAFDVVPGQPVDVDAVEKGDDGSIYLSLEDDVWIRGGAVLALDGDMLMIKAADLTYSGCQVVAVTPAAGTIAVYESAFDSMVLASGVANAAGVPVTTIGDLDGLAFDDAGAITWTSQGLDGAVVLPHFLFNGVNTDGAGVLSTQGGGRIAILNGQPLASAYPAPTTGVQMGLLPGTAPAVRVLGGLCLLTHQPLRVVADANPMLPVPGDTIHVDVGGLDALAGCGLLLQPGTAVACGAAAGLSVPNPGFGFWFGGAAPAVIGPIFADATGHVALAMPYAGGMPAATTLLMQPLTKKAGFAPVVIGAPALLQF